MHCSQTGQLKVYSRGWQNESRRRWLQLLSVGWASSALLQGSHRKAKRWILDGTSTMAMSNCDDSFLPSKEPDNQWPQQTHFTEDGTSPRPQLHWMRDQCPMLCLSQEPPAWATHGSGRFTLAQRPAVLVTAWLWAGLAATYRVRVLDLNTCCEHAPGEPQVCAPHCKWVGELLTTAAVCNHEQCQELVFKPHFWQPLLLHQAETWKKVPAYLKACLLFRPYSSSDWGLILLFILGLS